MWSSTCDSSADMRSTSVLAQLEPGQTGDVKYLIAIEHAGVHSRSARHGRRGRG